MVRLPIDRVSHAAEAKKKQIPRIRDNSATTGANKILGQMSGDARHIAQHWVCHLIVFTLRVFEHSITLTTWTTI